MITDRLQEELVKLMESHFEILQNMGLSHPTFIELLLLLMLLSSSLKKFYGRHTTVPPPDMGNRVVAGRWRTYRDRKKSVLGFNVVLPN